jgi:hypothetical protein
LNANEEHLRAELERLDPRLSALLVEGCRLCDVPDRSSNAFLIAHAGRELSRGVVALLESEGGPPAVADPDEPPGAAEVDVEAPTAEEQERNRERVARVLSLAVEDPRVTRWIQLVRVFSRNNKFRRGASDGDEVAAAFREFLSVLFGRLGPYFEAQAVVDELLAHPAPGPEEVTRLRAALGRPALRRYFFERALDPAWLPLLLEARLLAPPSPAAVDAQGRTSMPSWPEGDYLIRVGGQLPDLAAKVVAGLPVKLDNLSVWRQVAGLATQLPAPFAGDAAIRVAAALRRNTYARFFAFACFPMIRHLAELGDARALHVARDLLAIQSRSTQQAAAGPRSRLLNAGGPTLEILDDHELKEFLDEVFPALIAADARGSFELLMERLTVAIRQSAPPPPGSPWSVSKVWCRDLESRDSARDDPRGRLATALLVAARSLARSSDADAEWVLAQLDTEHHEIFTRIAMMVVAETGGRTLDRLDQIVCAASFLDAPWGDRESATLLRLQFKSASGGARRLVVHGVERGPDVEYLRVVLANRGKVDPSEEEIAAEVAHWQRRRLRWFEGAVPDEFQSLAERLGYDPTPPTREERDLAYDGFSAGSFGWVGDTSPLSDEEIAALPVVDLVRYIAEWRPERHELGGPSRVGLISAVKRLIGMDQTRSEALARATAEFTPFSSDLAEVLFWGAAQQVEAAGEVSWDALLALGDAAISALQSSSVDADPSAVMGLLRLVEAGARKGRISASASDDVWALLERALSVPHGQDVPLEVSVGFDRVVSLSTSQASGLATSAAVEVALSAFRQDVEGAADRQSAAEARESIALRLTPLLEHVLRLEGEAGAAAQVMLGRYLPYIWLMVPSWFEAARAILFEGGITDAQRRPVWGGYLTGPTYFSALFPLLRPWYAESARSLPEETADASRSWSLMGHLVTHLAIATVRGDLPVEDADGLLVRALDRAHVERRTHAYWEIFRAWKDAEQSPPPEFISRLLAFWRARLDHLASSEISQSAEEAAGLGWFIVTPHLPAEDVLTLARRTLKVAKLETGLPDLWMRMKELAEYDLAATLDIAELLFEQALAREYRYLPFDEVAPVLRIALRASAPELRGKAERLVHWLGENFSNDFRALIEVPPAST